MKTLKQLKLGALALLALPPLVGYPTTPVHAQESELVLEEIVVLARRRSENLQEIPESVTVVNAQTIQNAGIRNLRELSALVPNLNMFSGEQSFRAGVINLVIRGIGTPQTGEAPVSFVVDGVTAPEVDFINQELFNIENVQVLRGPQGALYGRGALGGAILVTTKQPTNEFSGFLNAGIEEGDEYRLQGGISGPISEDKVFFHLSGSYVDRDGQINNSTLNRAVDFKESTLIRGGLKFIASDKVTVDWKFSNLTSDLGGGIFEITANDQFNSNVGDLIDQNVLGENSRDVFETSLKIDWSIGDAQLTSVTAYGEVDDEIISDADFGPVEDGAQRNANSIESFTQELRLTSSDDQALRWIIGAFYQDRSREFDFDFALDDIGQSGAGGAFGDRFTVVFEQRDNTDTTATGLFGHLSYDLSDRLELTGALRYDKDEREFVDPRNPLTNGTTEFSEVQPKVSLSYAISEDTLGYVLYSHGFRSGGYNEVGFLTGDFDAPPSIYQPELSDSVEAGIKSTLFGGRTTLNAAAFYTELENNQFTGFDVNTFTLGILGINEAEITGLEAELVSRLTESLDVSLGIGIIDSEIVDSDGTGANDGNNIPFVPDYTVNLSAQYEAPISSQANFLARIDYTRVGEYSFGQDNIVKADTTDTVNLRLGVSFEKWSVAAYVRNATDERVAVDQFDFDVDVSARSPNAPRAAGVEFRVDF